MRNKEAPIFRPFGKEVVSASLAKKGETITVFPAGQRAFQFEATVLGRKETVFGDKIFNKITRKTKFIEAYRTIHVIVERRGEKGQERLSIGAGTAILRKEF